MRIMVDIHDWYESVVYISRILTVVMGSTFAALLVKNAWSHYRDYSKAEVSGFWLLMVWTLNAVGFTVMVLGDTIPRVPNSLIYIGWIISFIFGYSMLFHARRVA